jgi:hypothetical protein
VVVVMGITGMLFLRISGGEFYFFFYFLGLECCLCARLCFKFEAQGRGFAWE